MNGWAPLPLRLILGFGFLYHGLPKLLVQAEREMFLGMLQGIGVPVAGLMAWVIGILEVASGLALIAGAFTTIAAALMAVNMVVALITIHLPMGFNFINITEMTEAGPSFGLPGYEVNLLYLAGLVALMLTGAGKLSVDNRSK